MNVIVFMGNKLVIPFYNSVLGVLAILYYCAAIEYNRVSAPEVLKNRTYLSFLSIPSSSWIHAWKHVQNKKGTNQ